MTKEQNSNLAANTETKEHHDVFGTESTVEAWDQDYYHPIAVRYYDKAVPWLLDTMQAKPGSLVLDAGCGPGVHSIRAAKHGCNVHGLDISRTMLRHAARRATDAFVSDKIDFREGNLTEFEVDAPYDHVFSWGVIIHIPEYKDVLKCLANSVAPGGHLGLQILSRDSFDFRSELMLRKLARRPLKEMVETDLGTGTWYEMEGDRLWVMRFDIEALTEHLAQYGFEPVARRTAEFTEYQRRLPEILRPPLLYLNSLFHKLNFASRRSATQMLVFRKKDS